MICGRMIYDRMIDGRACPGGTIIRDHDGANPDTALPLLSRAGIHFNRCILLHGFPLRGYNQG